MLQIREFHELVSNNDKRISKESVINNNKKISGVSNNNKRIS